MRARLLLGLLLVALVIAGCSGDSADDVPPIETSDGQPRSFAMGLSSLPAELTEESYEDAFQLAASAGEVILIQRTPPWEELLSGAISETTAASTQLEVDLAKEHGLDLFVAIDPTDPAQGRAQLAGLPAELRGAGFANEDVQRAFLSYAQYVATNYQPRYLALGVEINNYRQAQPEDFERFVILYHQAYEAVKELSPETLIFPIFQLEHMQGLLPADQPRLPQWFLISRFEPRLDVLAVSSYPSLVFSDPEQMPPSYYAQLDAYTDRPIAIAGMGYSSGETEGGTNDGTEAAQLAFLKRALEDAQQLAMPFVVWFVGQDPAFTGSAELERLRHIGLLRQDGSSKPAWREWLSTSRRPITEAGASAESD